MKRSKKSLLLLILGCVLGLLIGVVLATLYIDKESNVGFKQQIFTLTHKEELKGISDENYVPMDISMGEVYVEGKRKSITNSKVGDYVTKSDYYKNEDWETPIIITDYTLSDYFDTDSKVLGYDTFYYYDISDDTKSDKEKEIMVLMGYNQSQEDEDAENCTVFGIGYEVYPKAIFYKGIKNGIKRETAEKILEGFRNIAKTDGYSCYVDGNNNYIRLSYENGIVTSVITGNTYNEQAILEALQS